MACLSSRIPHGEAVSEEKLRMVETAEYLLRDLGFFDVRVRHHELKHGCLARIEVGPAEMARFLEVGQSQSIARSLRALGYAHVTLDLYGYRRAEAAALPPLDVASPVMAKSPR